MMGERMKKKFKLENFLEPWKQVKAIMDKAYFLKYPEAHLRLNYANARFSISELAFKIQENDPRVYFTAKRITEKKEIAIHLRCPVKDEINNLEEFLDIDIYFPQEEVKKVQDLIPTKK
jgi:hypothetical protein